ncbi:MAG: hypothetical protein RI953_520, partial [Pseudomonadota bacterium]
TASAGVEGIALVYGGLTSITATHSFGGANAATSATAATNNLVITGVAAKMRKPELAGTNINGTLTESADFAKTDFASGNNETISFGTTSGTLTSATLPIATSTATNCTFNNTGNCTPTTATATMSLRVVESARVISLTLRGVTVNLPGLTVTPAGANRLEAEIFRSDNTLVTATSAMNAGQSVGARIRAFDEFNNATSFKNGTTTECTFTNNDLTGTGLNDLNSELTKAGRQFSKSATGVYEIAHNFTLGAVTGLTIKKMGTHVLTFNMCDRSTTLSVKVDTGSHAYTRVSTSTAVPNNPTSAAVTIVRERCSLNSSDPGVSCLPVNAYFFDQFDNQLTGITCPSWVYTKRSPDTTAISDENRATLTSTTNSIQTQLRSTDFIDGDLTCQFAATDPRNHSIHLYGGVHSIVATHPTIPANLVAAQSNFTITNVQFKGPAYDSNGAYSLANLPGPINGEPIAMTSNTTAASVGTTTTPVNPAFSCDFNNSGICATSTPTTAFTLNLTKIQADVRFEVKARGKTFISPSINVVAGRANQDRSGYTVVNAGGDAKPNNNVAADELFGVDFSVRDQFGNLTDILTGSDADCSDATTVEQTTVLNSGYNAPTSNTNPSLGVYRVRGIKLTGAGANTLTFKPCNLTFPVTMTVSPGGWAKTIVTTNTTAPAGNTDQTVSLVRCPLAGTGAGVVCPGINAYFYDQFGNPNPPAATCTTWEYTKVTAGRNADELSDETAVVVSPAGGTSSTRVTSTAFIDGELRCVGNAADPTSTKNHKIKIYGGAKSISVAGAPAASTNLTAGAGNVSITSVNLQGPTYTGAGAWSGIGTISDTMTNDPVSMTTTASAATVGTTAAVVTSSFTCTFNAGSCVPANTIPTNSLTLNFTRAESGRSFTVTARGLTYTAPTFNILGGNADTNQSGYTLLNSTDNPKANNAFTADDTFGINFAIRDQFGNMTDKTQAGGNCDADATSRATTFTGTIPAAGDTSAGSVTPSAGADNTRAGVGDYRIRNMRLKGIGDYAVTFTTCGVAKAITFNVTAGAWAKSIVSRATTAPAGNTTPIEEHERCALASSGPGATCGAVNLYTYDAYGNARTDSCPTWTYTKRTTAEVSDHNKVSLSATNGRSVIVSSTDFMDGDLKCVGSADNSVPAKNHSIHLYGGVHSITVDHTSVAAVVAGLNSVTINSVTLKGPSYTAAGAYSLETVPAGPQADQISLSSTATPSPVGTTSAVATALLTCNYTSTGADIGMCKAADTTPANSFHLNFTKVETGRTFTVTARGKSKTSTAFDIAPGSANSATSTATVLDSSNVAKANNTVNAGEDFGINFSIRDAFNNLTDKTNTGGDCSAAPTTTYTTTNIPNNGNATAGHIAGTSSRAGLGDYQLRTMKLTGLSTTGFDVDFTICGIAKTINFKVNPGTPAKHYLNSGTTASKTNSDVMTMCNLTANGGADCGMVYAWFYDAYGNNVPGATCSSWTLTRNSINTADHWGGSNTAGSASIKVITASALDSTLTCTRAGSVEDGTLGIRLFGGFNSIEATMPDASAIVAGNDFRVQNITLKGYNNGTQQTMPYTASSIPINFGTTALIGRDGTTFTTTPSTTCNFSSGICPSTYTFAFRRADATAQSLTLNVHGVSSVTGVASSNTDPTRLTTLVVTPNPTVGEFTTTLPATVEADATFSGNLNFLDAYKNPTCDAAVTLTPPGGTTSPNASTASFGTISKTSTGVFSLAGSSIPMVSGAGFTLTFNVCSQTRTHTIRVTPGAWAKSIVSRSTTAPAGNTTPSVEHERCALASTGPGVGCGVVNLYTYDAYGNARTDSCPTWTYTKRTTAEVSDHNKVSLSATSGGSVIVSSTDFMDGDLKCVGDAATTSSPKNHSIHLYGGVHSIDFTNTSLDAVVAGENSVTINSVTLKGPSYTTAGVYSLAALPEGPQNDQISLDSTATPSAVGTTRDVITPLLTCNYNTSGVCLTASVSPANSFQLNFTKVETGRTFTVTARGKSKTSTAFDIAPGSANSATSTATVLDSSNVAKANNTVNAGEDFGINFSIRDAFNNPTDKTNSGGDCSAAPTTNYTTTNIPNNGNGTAGHIAGTSSRAGLGAYQLRTMKLTGLSTTGFNIDFTTCGITKTINFKVNPGTPAKHYLNASTTASKTNTEAMSMCSLTANGGADCGQVYAWFYDYYGNNVPGATCSSWTLTRISSNTAEHWSSDAAGSASIKVTTASALDSKLSCNHAASVEDTSGSTVTGIRLFGGFNSIEATMPDASEVVAGSDFRVQNITLKGYNNGAQQTMPYSVNSIPINFSTTALIGRDGTSFTSTPSTTCNFSSGVCSTTHTFTFRRADSTARTLSLNVHGVSSVTGVASSNTDPTKLTTIVVTPNPTVGEFTTTLPSTVAADATFSGNLNFLDAYKNPTCDDAVTLTAPSGTASPNASTASFGAISKTSTGVFSLASSSIPMVSNTGFTLTFNLCASQTRTHTVRVTEGALASIKLLSNSVSTSADVQAGTATSTISCKHTTASGNGVACDPVYAYFRDSKGNLITDATKTCTWTYTPVSGNAPGTIAASRVATLSSSTYLDGTLGCTHGTGGTAISSGTTPAVQGGISRVELRMAASDATANISANGTLLNAGNNNLAVHRIKLFTRANNVEQDANSADYTLNAEALTFTTTATKSIWPGASNVIPASPACNFTTGFCGAADAATNAFTTAPVKLSLTKAATAVSVSVSVRGVASNSISFDVTAGDATSLDVLPIASQTAGTAFTPTVTGYDASGNQSLKGCTDFSMTGGNTSANNDAPTFSWTNTGFDNATATTVPGASVNLKAAGQQSITITGTCATTLSATASVSVNALATASKFMISTVDAATLAQVPTYSTSTTDVASATLNGSDTSVSCPALFAYSYDTYGNVISGSQSQTCFWYKTPQGGTEALHGSTLIHTNTFSSTNTIPDIDMTVRCKNTMSTPTITSNDVRLYGGPKKVELTTYPASTSTSPTYTMSGTTLAAAFGNAWLTGVKLLSNKAGVAVAMPGVGGTTQTISVTLQGTGNNAISGTATTAEVLSTTTAQVHAGSISSCSFTSSGDCTPGSAGTMHFKKTETGTRTLRVSARGVSADVTIPQIVAGTASTLNIQNLPSTYSVDTYADATSSIAVTVTAVDAFGNTTTNAANGGNCNLAISGNEQGAFADSISYGTQPATTANLKIYKAKTHTLSFSKCGVSKTQDIEITAGAMRRALITTTNTQPANYSCSASGDNIGSSRECDISVTCSVNAVGTAAGGNGCPGFYAWHYDKAGNYISSGSRDCTTTAAGAYTPDAGTTGGTVGSLPSGAGMKVTSNTLTNYLQGSLRCKPPAGTTDLGGTKVALLAPVKIDAPVVSCTPWIYNSEQTIKVYALCQFKNETGTDLTAYVANSTNAVAGDEAEPTFQPLGNMNTETALTANSLGQFIVNGTFSKKSSPFKVFFNSADPQKVVIQGDSPLLRVPLRNETDPTNNATVGQKTAIEAGANTSFAETAEPATVNTVITINGTDYYRRPNFYNLVGTVVETNGTATQVAWATNASNCLNTTGAGKNATTRCLKNAYIGVGDSPTGYPLLLAYDFLNHSTSQEKKFGIHPMSTEYLFVDFPALPNTAYCANKSTTQEKHAGSCQYSLYAPDTSAGLRGVFWLKDDLGRTFYFMTEAIP